MNVIKYLKRKLINYKRIYRLLQLFKFVFSARISEATGGDKKYPKVIQLPLTYKCNARCVMCNIWNMDNANEMNLEEFTRFLNDPIFKEVESVGINGGEPTVIRDLPQIAAEILKLPKLKSLNIISNGINSKKVTDNLAAIYCQCRLKGIYFHVSISLDGIGSVHDSVRGVSQAFSKTIHTIDEIHKNKNIYCDSIDLACTIVKQNINHLVELDEFAAKHGYDIKYRLSVENRRINSDSIVDNFSVLRCSLRQSAKEFFYGQMFKSQNFRDKFKYFSIFRFLEEENPHRLLGCAWKDEGITLDSRGNLYYCAVASDNLGSLRERCGEEIFFSEENIAHRMKILATKCDLCPHDYYGNPTLISVYSYLRAVFFLRYSMLFYRIKKQIL